MDGVVKLSGKIDQRQCVHCHSSKLSLQPVRANYAVHPIDGGRCPSTAGQLRPSVAISRTRAARPTTNRRHQPNH